VKSFETDKYSDGKFHADCMKCVSECMNWNKGLCGLRFVDSEA